MLLNILQSPGKQHTLCNKDLFTQNVNSARLGNLIQRGWTGKDGATRVEVIDCSDASGLCLLEEKHSLCGDCGKVPCITRR